MTLPRIWHIIKSKMITGPERRTLMIYILTAFCAVLVYVFLEKEAEKQYVPAVILKGLASLCYS